MGRADAKLFVAGLRENATARFFLLQMRSPNNQRTMEAGLWGIGAVRLNAESVRYLLST
jgi:hypothetical protein